MSFPGVNQLFQSVFQVSEGKSGLYWFLGKSEHGNQFIFTRGNVDFWCYLSDICLPWQANCNNNYETRRRY